MWAGSQSAQHRAAAAAAIPSPHSNIPPDPSLLDDDASINADQFDAIMVDLNVPTDGTHHEVSTPTSEQPDADPVIRHDDAPASAGAVEQVSSN